MAARQRYVDEGRLLSSADLCARRGISRQALSKAIKEHRLFTVAGPSNTQLYPAFFATETRRLKLFERVSRVLGAMPGPSKWEFFMTPKLSLDGKKPLVLIDEAGNDAVATAVAMDRVLNAARGFKERVFGP